jgi:hypothetical protein
LKEKVAASVYDTKIMGIGDRCTDYVTPFYPQMLALASPTSGGDSDGIICLWTQATEIFVCQIVMNKICKCRTSEFDFNV